MLMVWDLKNTRAGNGAFKLRVAQITAIVGPHLVSPAAAADPTFCTASLRFK
jgi:hypothetical protein